MEQEPAEDYQQSGSLGSHCYRVLCYTAGSQVEGKTSLKRTANETTLRHLCDWQRS